MSNQFVNLPVPASNAAGAAVDTSKMGATKTIIVGGSFNACVTIEYATDDLGLVWAPVPNGSFVGNPGRVTFDFAAHWMRAVTSQFKGGAPNADVGSSGAGSAFVDLTGGGTVDISALPRLKTVVAAGAGIVEVSDDGIDWSQAFAFQNAGGQTAIIYGQFARLVGGSSAWMGGAEEGDGGGTLPFKLETLDFYFSPLTGSDESGNGTLAAPYETLKHTLNTLDPNPAPGRSYLVIGLGKGVEQFPFSYCMPNIQFPCLDYPTDFSVTPWYSGAGLRIRSQPQLVEVVPPAPSEMVIGPADGATIASDPDTNLITLVIASPARASWTQANLGDKMIMRTLGSQKAFCTIREVPPGGQTLILDQSSFSFNGTPNNVVPQPVVFVGADELNIVEHQIELRMDPNGPPVDELGDGFGACQSTINSIAIQGFKLTQPGAFFAEAIGFLNCPQVNLEGCDIDGLGVQGDAGTYWCYLNACIVRKSLIAVNGSVFHRACGYRGNGLFYMVNATPQSFQDTSFVGCGSIESARQNGLPITMNIAFQNVLFQDTQVPFFGGSGDAINISDGRVVLDHVQVNNAAGRALVANTPAAVASAVHLTGSGNGGAVAIESTDGAAINVDATTNVTAAVPGTDVKSGGLAAVSYATLAVTQQWDLTVNVLGSPAVGSGSVIKVV